MIILKKVKDVLSVVALVLFAGYNEEKFNL
jgi:hypothetical protein